MITLAIRTPLAKGKKGGFKDTDLDYIVYALLKQLVDKSKIDPSLVEDICLGNVSLYNVRSVMQWLTYCVRRSVTPELHTKSARPRLPLDSPIPQAPAASTDSALRA